MLLVLPAILAGCATNDGQPYPHFNRLEIVALTTAPASGPAKSTGELAAEGAAAGVASGVAGGAVLSLMCGPFYGACFTGFALSYTGLEALVGASDGLSGLSGEQLAQVNQYFASLVRSRDINQELVAAVSARLPADRLETGTAADARMTIGSKSLRIIQAPEAKFALSLSIATHLEMNTGKKPPPAIVRTYECQTPSLGVEDWLVNDGTAFEREFSACIGDLSTRVNAALAAPKKPDQAR
jgi:hypothetical protein